MDKIHLEISKGQKLLFSSDQHFGHRNILDFCHRPFSSVEEMGQELIRKWNEVVGPEDTVVTLGDFCWWDSNKGIQKILNQLNGTIYIVPGNHDSDKGFRELPQHVILLDSIAHFWITFEGDSKIHEVVCSHYPLMTWSGRGRGVINLFGHIHTEKGGKGLSFDKDLPLWKNQYDVGVDQNDYTPVEYFYILQNKIELT